MARRKCLLSSVLSLAATLALVGSIAAQNASGAAKVGGHGGAKALKAARHLLHTALHDYDGHRAAAAKHVTEALHDLAPQPSSTQAGTTTPQSTTPQAPAGSPMATPSGTKAAKPNSGQGTASGQETQEDSDKKLREAKQILEKVQPNLTQHPKAAEHVAKAIKEIDTALTKK